MRDRLTVFGWLLIALMALGLTFGTLGLLREPGRWAEFVVLLATIGFVAVGMTMKHHAK